jgi:hypothetical protein
MIRLLLSHGADKSKRTYTGILPLGMYTGRFTNKLVAALLTAESEQKKPFSSTPFSPDEAAFSEEKTLSEDHFFATKYSSYVPSTSVLEESELLSKSVVPLPDTNEIDDVPAKKNSVLQFLTAAKSGSADENFYAVL